MNLTNDLVYFWISIGFRILGRTLACFLGALQLVAAKAGKKEVAAKAKIHTAVHLGVPEGMEGFGINVDIKVEGIEDESLIKAAHEVCSYSCHWLPLLNVLANLTFYFLVLSVQSCSSARRESHCH